jgi:two-component system, NarL family, nitrate/nitrite response regulator NarL
MSTAEPVLVVDDEPKFRRLVVTLLAGAGLQCREAASGGEAVSLAKEDRPSLVVLDVRLPDVSGLEVCRVLRDEFGEDLPIVFVSGVKRDALDRSAGLLLGGDEYLVKPFDAEEFLARVRRLLVRSRAGGTPNGGSAASLPDLTNREREVLELLAAGRSRNSIAEALVISPKTVASHMQSLLAKLGVHSQAQAVAVAFQLGLVRPDDGSADVQASSWTLPPEELEAEAVWN